MPVMESLRRLDDRFAPKRDGARAVRSLPWVLLVAFLAHFVTLFTEVRFIDGAVSGLLLSSVLTAFVYLPGRERDNK